MYLISQRILKLFHAGGLKPRAVPSGTAILVSAVRRRYGQITLFIFTKSVPNAKETPNGSGGKVKPYKSGHSPLSPTVSPLHSSSLPSHPHQARFYRCVLICFIVSFIWFCLTSFTAAPPICGLALRYRVSAVSFA